MVKRDGKQVMKAILFIALGGAIGAIGRYGVTVAASQILGTSYPYGTVLVNIIGSFFLGALIEGSAHWGAFNNEFRVFLIVGVLGSFTTFSAFSMDVAMLINRNELFTAGLYIITSTVLSIGAYFLAMMLFRQLFQ